MGERIERGYTTRLIDNRQAQCVSVLVMYDSDASQVDRLIGESMAG